MFSQINNEMEELIINIQKHQDIVAQLRLDESNPNSYVELGGRLIGLQEVLDEVELTRLAINDHIINILQNTTDGNYANKVNNLEDENKVLREKIEILKDDLKRYNLSKVKTISKSAEELPLEDNEE